MKAYLWLRIGSVLALVHAILHTVGGVYGKPEPGAAATAVAAMKANIFPLMGLPRSFWMFYRGMGLAVTVFLIVSAVALWQLSTLAKVGELRLRPLYWTFGVGFSCFAVISWTYFFAGAWATELLIAGCLGMAIVASGRADQGIERQ
ncbi:MAG: hypothetical protein M3Y50_15430 [Acidobacteriota bacterium]|nr:hypothetical protein [Acidobacteriota bacterium]